MTDWNDVGQALLSSWPSQVASWGRSVLAGYCHELEVRGVTPEQALLAIRYSTDKFPPSAGEYRVLARKASEMERARRGRLAIEQRTRARLASASMMIEEGGN